MTERIRGKHGGTIFARGSILWIRYGDGRGNEIRETTKSSDPKLAEKMLANRIKQVHAAEINHQAFTVPKAHRLTVAEVLINSKLITDCMVNGMKSWPAIGESFTPVLATTGSNPSPERQSKTFNWKQKIPA